MKILNRIGNCATCNKQIQLCIIPIVTAKLFIGVCDKCDKTQFTLSGNPAEIMHDAVFLADSFMSMGVAIGETVGIPEPFMLDPDELSDLVNKSRANGGYSMRTH